MNADGRRHSILAALITVLCSTLFAHSAAAVSIALKGPDPANPGGPILDLGWTADVPAGVDLTDITISGTTIVFTKKATFTDFNPISITFTQNPLVVEGRDETFFNVKEEITNMTDKEWNDFHMTIADANDNVSDTGATHPRRAHFHPAAWDSTDPATDYLAVGFPDGNLGTYVMDLELKNGHAPTPTGGGKLTGQFMRLHDRLEAGANRMQFTLTEQPSAVPEPATLVLFAVGMLGLLAAARRRAGG